MIFCPKKLRKIGKWFKNRPNCLLKITLMTRWKHPSKKVQDVLGKIEMYGFLKIVLEIQQRRDTLAKVKQSKNASTNRIQNK